MTMSLNNNTVYLVTGANRGELVDFMICFKQLCGNVVGRYGPGTALSAQP